MAGKRSSATPAEVEQASLGEILESLGRDVIQVLSAPAGLDLPAAEPVIYDPEERSTIARGDVVLAVGIRAGTRQARRVIELAETAQAAAVVFKTSDTADDLRELGSSTVALIAVAEEMTWTQLYGLLSLTRFYATAETSAGIAGVPLGDLFALANAIAGVVGGAVTIEDAGRRVLAYSTLDDQPIDKARRGTILGRQVPDSPGMRALYREVLSADGVLWADAKTMKRTLQDAPTELDDLKSRSAVAIRAGSQAIGSIWVVHEENRLDGESEHALAEAARIAVPHVIQARATRDVERRLRAEMLLTVLEGDGSAEEAAARLGFSSAAPLSVIAFELADSEPPLDELQRERLVDVVLLHCEASFRQSAAVALGQTTYALLEGASAPEQERLVQLAGRIQTHAETRLGTALHAGVGSTVEAVRDVPLTRREAERVLGVLRVDPRRRTVASLGDVRSEVVLHELRELSLEHTGLARGKLDRVLAHDVEHGTSYAATLRVYLDAFGDVPKAAERISVHPNTFRYRMRRLVELFDLDLDDPDERVVLELQLRFDASDTTQRRR
ncbi:MAG TPA: helix-turn-helix domain-containing protein [Gaiellaceae bacterium]|nr:helix-turn-helix domain-containing protein [Gaiellaceae bacterium]